EVWYDDAGNVEKTVAMSALDGGFVRVVDQSYRELAFQDPRSHTLAVVAENGALLAGFSYGPYGELLRQVGPGSDDYLRRFNGKEWDETSGLSYYGYRYYDERTLTWTQADPKYRWTPDLDRRHPHYAALYQFAAGNPVRNVDPNGLQPKDPHKLGWLYEWWLWFVGKGRKWAPPAIHPEDGPEEVPRITEKAGQEEEEKRRGERDADNQEQPDPPEEKPAESSAPRVGDQYDGSGSFRRPTGGGSMQCPSACHSPEGRFWPTVQGNPQAKPGVWGTRHTVAVSMMVAPIALPAAVGKVGAVATGVGGAVSAFFGGGTVAIAPLVNAYAR
ncbi:MAG: RHS repeat-associated core domain-containing protein, partial [Myxococcales bacterium]|nr:RHS repeat-associated core domain-containing protein [Myxococcales bacterium]